jgi:hypothetical protein
VQAGIIWRSVLVRNAAGPSLGIVASQDQWQRLPAGKEMRAMNSGPDDLNSGPDDLYGEPGDLSPGSDDRDEWHNTEILESHDAWQGRRSQLVGLLVVAVVALAAGGGIAYVATHSGNGASPAAAQGAAQSPAPTPAASTPSFRGHGPRGFGHFGGFGGFGLGGLGGVVHGQVTERTPSGGYQTVDIQTGTVTAVSSSSITVNSADGYSATYDVISSTEVNAQAAGISTVKVGDTVELTATVSGRTATAASIIDVTSIRSSRGSFNFPAGPPAAPAN